MKVLNRQQLSRDVIVFEMFGHFGELAAASEAEHGAALVDVDDALPTRTKRRTAILEFDSSASQSGLRETSRF